MSVSQLSMLRFVVSNPRSYFTLLVLVITCAPGLAAISLTATRDMNSLNASPYELACCGCCNCCCCCCCCCTNSEPTLVDFSAIYDSCADEWVLMGTIDDEAPEDCTVYFGGVLDGHETTVDEFGNFEYRVDEPDAGLVSAIAEDLDGQASDEGYDEITGLAA